MLAKPNSCVGCPLYGDGLGYVPDLIVEGSDTMIVLQNPGETEECHGAPAIGDTGQLMNATFIPLSGLHRNVRYDASNSGVFNNSDVSVGNVLKCRLTGNDGRKSNDLPVGQVLTDAVQHCTHAHFKVPEHVKYIIAQGALAFKYFSGDDLKEGNGKPSTLTDWRGHVLPSSHEYEGRPIFIVGHLADIFRDPKQRWIAEQDWRKAGELRSGTYPRAVPERITIHNLEQWAHAYEWIQQAIKSKAIIICDTEFYPDTKFLTVVGLGYRHSNGSVVGLQFDLRDCEPELKPQLAWALQHLTRTNEFVFHNAIADILVMEANLGIKYNDYLKVQDTMLAHAVMWGELPHTLDFCSSIYSQYPRLKNLSGEDLLYYNWGDIIATLATYEALSEDLKYDAGAREVYKGQLLKLVPILAGSKTRGIRINPARVLEAQPLLHAGMASAERLSRVGTGRIAFNLGSDDQLKDWLYRTKALDVQKNKDTKRATTDDDAIGVLRELVGPSFDPKVDLTEVLALDRVLAGADPVLESRVLYVQHEHILNNYIYPLHIKAPNGHHSKAKFNRQLRSGGVWGAQDIRERVFPDIATHIQKSGRHSTSNPPLAQLPAEYRDIIRPEADCLWIKWDWSSVEPRLLEALCGSVILKRSFDEGIDLHTWTVCEIFGYPQPADLVNPHKCKCEAKDCEHQRWRELVAWKGKEDPRRVFAKTGRYEVWYGGTGSNAASAAARFGLDRRLLKQAVQKLASSDSDYYRWRCEVEAEVKRTRLIRSWGGRPRRLLGQGSGVIREALNHPMQAGVSDIYNLTIIQLEEVYGQTIDFVFGMHDSQYWSCKVGDFTPALFTGVKGVVEQPRNILGVVRAFPADFELTDEWSNHYGNSYAYSIDDYFNGKRY